jgi:hypothetical protein
MYYDTNKATMMNKFTSSASHFDGRGGVPEQYRQHPPMRHVQGYSKKPLDASIRRLLALYRPSGRQGNRQTNNNQQIHLQSWPF